MNATPRKIYVALLHEGTAVWRPTLAEPCGGNTFLVLGPLPENEQWEFAPGTLVQVAERVFAGGERALVAVAANHA